MVSAEEVPTSLTSLGLEAVEAIASTQDITTFRATALYNMARDSIVKSLPSFTAARAAICEPPLVAERYGVLDDVGDRLTLQFVYQLFPRTDRRSVRLDIRRLWRRFLTELKVPAWVFRGVANLRNFAADPDITNPVRLAEGVSIRRRSFEELKSLGFNDMTLDALRDDWSVGGHSEHVICVEHSKRKTPDNLILNDATGITTALRAVTCLRLAGRGDIMMGPMWFTRSGRFNVGLGFGAGRSGWQIPVTGGSQPFARAMPARVRSRTSSRSISASAARMWNSSRPTGLVVLNPSVRLTNWTLRLRRSSTTCTRWETNRPSRSSFHTVSVSP
jgi:hypothetical protein